MHAQTYDWLRSQHSKAAVYQSANGINFDLTLEDYISLWSTYRLNKLEKLILTNRIKGFQKNPRHAWVLSWRSKRDRAAGTMNKVTARILQRWESEVVFRIQRGETQSASARRKIGDARRGKPLTAQHKAAIGNSRRGIQQTAEHKRKRIEAMRATKARKRDLLGGPTLLRLISENSAISAVGSNGGK